MATLIKRNNKFLVRVRLKGYPSVSQTFLDKRSAQVWAIATEDAIRRGVYEFGKADLPTLKQALSRYGKEITPAKRGANRERHVIRMLEGLPLANKTLDQITAMELSKLRDAWLKLVSPSTIQKRHALLSHLYSIAIREWGYDIPNPLLRVSKPKIDNRRTRTITTEELDAVLSAAPNDTLKVVAFLAWHSAARLGELVALQWQDVNLTAYTMTFPITKNGSARTVPLVPSAARVLQAMQPKTQPGERLAGPVFTTSSMSMTKAWAAAVEKARKAYEQACYREGVTPEPEWLTDLRFHDLRHSAITRYAEHGLSTLKLAAISGHKSLSMLSRYTHISAEALAAELARLEQVTA